MAINNEQLQGIIRVRRVVDSSVISLRAQKTKVSFQKNLLFESTIEGVLSYSLSISISGS